MSRPELLLATFFAATACHPASAVRRAPPAPSRDAAPSPAAVATDLLHCDLELRAYELGAPDDGPPSAPVLGRDGVLVAFTHTRSVSADAIATDLVTQRLDGQGALQPPTTLRRDVHASVPRIAASGDRIRVVAVSGARFDLLELDTGTGGAQVDAPAVTLPFWPEDVTAGPRGLVATHSTRRNRFVRRDFGGAASPDVVLPPSEGMPVPQEQLVASGAAVDLVMFRTRTGVSLATLAPGAAAPTGDRELFPRVGETWAEASVAAGPSGFAIVRNGPAINAITLLRFDAQGVPAGEPTAVSDADGTRRHPRVSPLGDGWVVSYWDGVGPTILRFEADGRAIGRPAQVRSGDERGGHTEARMVASERALAVSWHVHEPEFSHGMPSERPRRPGPRLGIFRCASPPARSRTPPA